MQETRNRMLNLAHVAEKYEEETKTNASAHLVQYKYKIREGCPGGIRMTMAEGFVKEVNFKSGVKDPGSDRW